MARSRTAPVLPVDGPILNEHGAVVGMVCSTMALLDDDEGNVQMTWKLTRPSSSILALLNSGRATAAEALSRNGKAADSRFREAKAESQR